ncbi:MAG: Phospholipid-binding protein, PBP family [Parcubacteria group bacterium GW2011_GWC2_44_22]|nr:MAG: Phospholipid-binding protein, PBP family [Parcubacteria group bacterium GW2011_GWC2_44_22]
MSRAHFIVLLATILILSGCQPAPVINSMSKFTLTSSVFKDQELIPKLYTCDGADINPPLAISNVPTAVKSLVLIVDDPDAPGGLWTHWLVWNISPETTKIAEGSVPTGAVQGTTDFGRADWGGPCPPSGTHRYQFKLYALDAELDLPARTKQAGLEAAMVGHIVEQATLTGNYSRG